MITKSLAIIIGIVFLAIGFLGYTENAIVGLSPDAIFHADATHNNVHIISGALFLVFAFFVPQYLGTFMRVFGIVYFLIGIIGIINSGDTGMTHVLGFLHVNKADNYLHIGLGIIIFLAGMTARRR